MNTNFLTAIEIASILKISKALAYRLIKKGEIPSVRFGRTVRIKAEDLDSFIMNNSTSNSNHVYPSGKRKTLTSKTGTNRIVDAKTHTA